MMPIDFPFPLVQRGSALLTDASVWGATIRRNDDALADAVADRVLSDAELLDGLSGGLDDVGIISLTERQRLGMGCYEAASEWETLAMLAALQGYDDGIPLRCAARYEGYGELLDEGE